MIHGADKVIADIKRFERNWQTRGFEIPYELKTSIIRQIVRRGAIDTTAMIQAVDYHRDHVVDGSQNYRVDTSSNPDVFYDGFVEFQTANRDGTMRPGRYIYRDGIKNADIEGVTKRLMDDSFLI